MAVIEDKDHFNRFLTVSTIKSQGEFEDQSSIQRN